MVVIGSYDSSITVHASGYAYGKMLEVRDYMERWRLERGDKKRFTISDALDIIAAVFEGAEEDRDKFHMAIEKTEEQQKYWDDDFDSLRAEGRIP